MSTAALNAILAAGLSSVIGLVGGFLLLANYKGVKHWSRYFVSFAAGALMGAAFFDLLTEAIADYPTQVTEIFTWTMVGFLLLFMVEKVVLQHHHGDEEEEKHSHAHLIPLNIIGDAVHNFVDGTVIAATFLVNPAVGITTAVAVFFHEIPREIGDFSIMIYAGMTRRGVALWNIFGALVSPFAAILTVIVAQQVTAIQLPLLGIAAGNFIYIAAADLIPEIHSDKSKKSLFTQIALLLAGLLLIVWLSGQVG
jgi:zinc and cadmium transporter